MTRGHYISVVGCAKEVAEATAKVVLAARGETIAANEDFGTLITNAQKAIERHPGVGLAADEPIRLACQQASKVVRNLADLRNLCGTGHGRASAPMVTAEAASMSIEMSMMWCRWALRRLAHVIFGRPQTLVAMLSGGETFYRGDFTRRIESANLSAAGQADQTALGMAVARRAMSGTFLIMDEGVEACALSSDLERWPTGYRYGLVQGLMFDAQGHLDTNQWAIRQIGLLLSQVDAVFILTVLEYQARSAYVSARLAPNDKRYEVRNAMIMEAGRMSAEAADLWQKTMDRIAPPAPPPSTPPLG